MRPCTFACLVANECSILDHRNRVWLLVWTVLWYDLVLRGTQTRITHRCLDHESRHRQWVCISNLLLYI
ncbi:hypothetical protein BDA96_09G133800 [Sorghum bicolor]|uniref:Uncharacterized protein n=2 Tax=Sorghum bicolor TaxID=4558 RepID=A0A921QCQ8_SORBI|nr:hypothetical protein BDA96_09G133800 [Sorghum bicolor]KXG21924.1 hypothetical protein SORBI_3009G127100 [Sorghum bicolor]